MSPDLLSLQAAAVLLTLLLGLFLLVTDRAGGVDLSAPGWVLLGTLTLAGSLGYAIFWGCSGVTFPSPWVFLPPALWGGYVLLRALIRPGRRHRALSPEDQRLRLLNCGAVLAAALLIALLLAYLFLGGFIRRASDGPVWLIPAYPLMAAALLPLLHMILRTALLALAVDALLVLAALPFLLIWAAATLFLLRGAHLTFRQRGTSPGRRFGTVLLILLPGLDLIAVRRLRPGAPPKAPPPPEPEAPAPQPPPTPSQSGGDPMKIIGLTGPTGSGKTTVLTALEAQGCLCLDCDRVYHDLLDASAPLREELTGRFGPDILDPQGQVDRKALGQVVFGDSAALADLNAIAHRHILAELKRRTDDARQAGRPAVVYDAIALLESGLGEWCDVTVAVTAPPEVRLRRIMARDGISEEYARSRMGVQKPDEFYVNYCDHAVINDGTKSPKELEAEIAALYRSILCKSIKEATTMEEKTKTPGEARREALLYRPKNGYDRLSSQDEIAMHSYCEGYKKFLDAGKTERECVTAAVALAQAKGFVPLTPGMALAPGDKVYRVNRGKAVMFAVIGSDSLAQGARIGAAHIDSPRLDLKPNPLYEEAEMAFFKTHYYGGIRKYQWVTIPLELHGVVSLKNGAAVTVSIGNGAGDPVFTVDDLLPHLAADQSRKPLGEAIPAENLNILVGSRPFKDDEGSDRVKLAVMDILHEKYGILEEDFISAELEVVPGFQAKDLGFDRSMIGSYGHDDRVCGYACLAALLDMDRVPAKTAVCMLADKEEIGSEGVSGMRSAAFDTFMADLCDSQQVPLKRCFESSFCLSADVTAAFDPNFAEVYEKRNSARINYGVALCKYTGSRGKGGASDAGAELVGWTRRVLDDADVVWQMAELGKVDQGGGGTVAVYMAQRNIDVLDAGVPVLSMHAPFETVSKLDCYMTYKAAQAVYLAD